MLAVPEFDQSGMWAVTVWCSFLRSKPQKERRFWHERDMLGIRNLLVMLFYYSPIVLVKVVDQLLQLFVRNKSTFFIEFACEAPQTNLTSKYVTNSCYFTKEGKRKWRGVSGGSNRYLVIVVAYRKYITGEFLVSIFIYFVLKAKMRFLNQMYCYLQQKQYWVPFP